MRAMPIRIALFLLLGLLAMQALAAPPQDQLTLPRVFILRCIPIRWRMRARSRWARSAQCLLVPATPARCMC